MHHRLLHLRAHGLWEGDAYPTYCKTLIFCMHLIIIIIIIIEFIVRASLQVRVSAAPLHVQPWASCSHTCASVYQAV